jgi:hypothetical protein
MHARTGPQQLSPRPPPKNTAEDRRKARERRRREPGLPRYRLPGNSWETPLTAPPPPIIGDPAAFVEAERGQWLAEVIENARRLLPRDRADVFLKLLKLTSLHRVRVDVNARLDRLQPEPNLSQLTAEQLDRILAGDAIETEALPIK